MARLVGKAAAVPDTEEVDTVTELAPQKMPTVDEVLEAVGTDTVALKARIGDLLGKFPNGVPQALLFDVINNAVSPQALFLKIAEAYIAATGVALTGGGPVGHSSAEVA